MSLLERLATSVLGKLVKSAIDKILKPKKQKRPKNSKSKDFDDEISHPWHLCPPGKIWIRTHPLNMPSGETTRRGHCRTQGGDGNIYTADEFKEIAHEQFNQLQKDKGVRNA